MRDQRPPTIERGPRAGGAGSSPPGGATSPPPVGGRPLRVRRRAAFTLIELLTVIVIIGIILTLILVAASGAQRQAEMAATQSLIAKLDAAINDRLDALLQTRPDYNYAHWYMANVYYTASGNTYNAPSIPRAQAIAWYDFIKAEMPDVFYVQNTTGRYPLNFAFPETGLPGTTALPSLSSAAGPYAPMILPLGNSTYNLPTGYYGGAPVGATFVTNPSGTGIFGASYFAAAGVYKNLGYLPAGFDGVDGNGDDLIDDWAEGVTTAGGNQAAVVANLQAHRHHTARAEMLYALLVEGVGPLGSVFNRDDFTDKEVRDTDGDGLPEFVDSWGNPLQFFRWPVMFPSDVQRGQVELPDQTPSGAGLPTLVPPYYSATSSVATFLPRENSPLDPNNHLVAPAWWSATQNTWSPFLGTTGTTQNGSPAVNLFESFFHRLTEPLQHTGNPENYWDRGGSAEFGYRRAFYSRPLILSGGPDGTPGVYLIPDGGSASMTLNATNLIRFENNALIFDPVEAGFNGQVLNIQNFGTSTNSYSLWQAGKDDISNQNRQTAGGGGGS